jgi:hypothetical protein
MTTPNNAHSSAPVKSPSTPSPLRLVPEQTLFLCVDIQERLAGAMSTELLARLHKNALALLRGAAALAVPILVSEQYKKGLGELLPELAAALPSGTARFDKLAFSAWNDAAIARAIADHSGDGRSQIVVFGMETHICVYQTARDLCHAGFRVFVPHDAVCSRDMENLRVGLVLCERAGATVTSTESVLFDLLGTAAAPAFKPVSALVK